MVSFFSKIKIYFSHACTYRMTSGQSLIETIVAISLLTTGIIGGMSLAIYSLGSSEVINSQIIAAGLAREGVEIVRNLRDTQWRLSTPRDCYPAICPDPGACPAGPQQCYITWLDRFDDLPSDTTPQTYYAVFNPLDDGRDGWQLTPTTDSDPETFRLYRGVSATYVADSSLPGTRFYRKIDLQRQESTPFNPLNPRISALSTVYWTGKNCPLEEDINDMRCKVTVQEYLTNWKNY